MRQIVELDPADVNTRQARGEIALVDVREDKEIAVERIKGAYAMPLSRFEPAALPKGNIVLFCAGGKRSAMALAKCHEAGIKPVGHVRGGLTGWKAAGLPTEH